MSVAIGPYQLDNCLALAPMAGVTDLPFRRLCRELGAGYVVGEMLSSDPRLRNSRKSVLRRQHDNEVSPIAVQIAGAEPHWMAEAAQFNVAHGAQIIDINMGCPAKKVCQKMAGSALLEDEYLVERILTAVVSAVDVPVTLKIRTGPKPERRNGVTIARIAERCGIQALAVHGRTRAERFKGNAEYNTIGDICASVSIPVFANGDLGTPEKAIEVLNTTGADGLMLGRGAQGNPWLFREVLYTMETGKRLPVPEPAEVRSIMLKHLQELHEFYGEPQGVRVARKHFGWYLKGRPGGPALRDKLVRVQSAAEQIELLECYFSSTAQSQAA